MVRVLSLALRIQHVSVDGDPQFQVFRVSEPKLTTPKPITSPYGFPVERRPDSDLMQELRWYLEDFLEYPFHPETEHAEHVLEALHSWGRQAFNALFNNKQAAEFLIEARKGGRYDQLHLQIWLTARAHLRWSKIGRAIPQRQSR